MELRCLPLLIYFWPGRCRTRRLGTFLRGESTVLMAEIRWELTQLRVVVCLCHFFTQVWDTSQVVFEKTGFLNHQLRMGCWSSNPEACWNIWRWDFSCLLREWIHIPTGEVGKIIDSKVNWEGVVSFQEGKLKYMVLHCGERIDG